MQALKITKGYQVVMVLALLLASCTYDVLEEEVDTNDCHPAVVSYSTHVVPILQAASCIGCHNTSSPSAGINLDNHPDVVKSVNSGRLMGSIRHDSGFAAMPQGGSKLSDCSIETIAAWIDQGALDN